MPPLRTTVGRLLVNRALPPAVRDYHRVFDAAAAAGVMQRVAEEHPEEYPAVLRRLNRIGAEEGFRSGGYGFGLSDLSVPAAAAAARAGLSARVAALFADPKLGPDEKAKRVVAALSAGQAPAEAAVMAASAAEKNPAALLVQSGSRGKPKNLKAMRYGAGLYTDNRDRPIAVPVLHSFAEGLSPAEYYAATFGARKGLVEVKRGTAEGGYLAKLLGQAAHRLVVTAHDAAEPDRYPRGLPVDADDPDNAGALLAMPAAGFARNTPLTPPVLAKIRAAGVKKLLVRSPLASNPPEGGVYGRDVGVRERGGIPAAGEHVGRAAADALAEPAIQSRLGAKHTGGVAGAGGTVVGFQAIEQLAQSPKASAYWAAHAQHTGVVGRVERAPAGGHFVTVGGERHHVPEGQTVSVAAGDEVEAGDALSDGLPNPAELVRHKGIGEGARQYVAAFRRAMTGAGLPVDRRNVELVARGLVNHVKLTADVGPHLAGETVPYDVLERDYSPRDGAHDLRPADAAGRYLEAPVLHHTVGTRLTPRTAAELADFGVKTVLAHSDPPPFEPVYVRGADNLLYDPDWMSRMLGSNLRKGFLRGVHEGAVSDESGTSFVPSLARGVDFGRAGLVKTPGPAVPA